MQELEQLLERFWRNQLSPAELKQLYYLLSIHKEELQANATINFNEVAEAIAKQITAERSRVLLQNIHNRLDLPSANGKLIRLRKTMVSLAVAACFIGLLAVTVLWFTNHTAHTDTVAVNKDSLPPLRSFANNTDTNQVIRLADGSVVELTPHAAITYYQPFINNRRDIALTGTALFKVAKDKTKPFTVYANGISTTALGTQFWVYASNRQQTGVHLLEGKVVIKATPGAGVTMNDVYLVPGQRFSLNAATHQMAVQQVGTSQQPSLHNSDPHFTQQPIAGSLTFNNEPVENVLQQIQQAYHQPLLFNKAEVKGLTFTGTFLPTDNLQIVLSAICNMNNLSFKNEGSSITISKQK